MTTKANWDKLVQRVNNNKNENKLQEIIKADLSILGEIYKEAEGEYICFSEFVIPGLGGKYGKVDFVVFTGRSRMNVYLIEVKGADFDLTNTRDLFNPKFLEGIDQVVSRSGYVGRRYDTFREDLHLIKHDVESGVKRFNSLIGSNGGLRADPRKDIVVHYVVIGGRRVDDVRDSKKINQWESLIGNSNVKLFSWDSWIHNKDGKIK